VLPDTLRAAGCEVDVVAAYETRAISSAASAALREALEAGGADIVLLTSGAIANSFVDALGDQAEILLERVTIASIGPVTSAAIRARGLAVDVEAAEYTVDGLLDALERHFTTE
jgi:uroporphyrinogen III methyltransferase/synthase